MKTEFTYGDIALVAKRSLFDEKYLVYFPVHIQEQIREVRRFFAGSTIEAIVQVMALSIFNYLNEIEEKGEIRT